MYIATLLKGREERRKLGEKKEEGRREGGRKELKYIERKIITKGIAERKILQLRGFKTEAETVLVLCSSPQMPRLTC